MFNPKVIASIVLGTAGIAAIGLSVLLSHRKARTIPPKGEAEDCTKTEQSSAHDSYSQATRDCVPLVLQPPTAPPQPPVTNEMLVQRLRAEPSFRFELPTKSKFQMHVENIAKRAMWDAVRADYTRGELDTLLGLITELKTRIKDLTPNRPDLCRSLDEALDEALLRQMLRKGALNHSMLGDFVRFVVDRLRELESPARNASTDSFFKSAAKTLSALSADDADTAFAFLQHFFDFAHEKIDTITLDLLNFRLELLRPTLEEKGIDYIRHAFETRLKKGEIGMDGTEAWLGAACLAVDSDTRDRVRSGDARAFVKVHASAILELLWRLPSDVKNEKCSLQPETVDVHGLERLRKRLRSLCRCCFLLMRINQFGALGDDALTAVQRLLGGTAEQVEISDVSTSDGKLTALSIVAEADGTLLGSIAAKRVLDVVVTDHQSRGVTLSETALEALRKLVEKTMDPLPSDPVANLVMKRLKQSIEDVVLHENKNDVREINRLKTLVGKGAILDEAVSLCNAVSAFAKRDYTVHAKRYNKLLSKLVIESI